MEYGVLSILPALIVIIFALLTKKTLEALDAVAEADVSHENGTAVVTLNSEVADDVLKNAVEEQDYKVTGIE